MHARLSGQDSTLAIDVDDTNAFEANFKQAYIHLYGHYVEERSIEIASISLKALVKSEEKLEPIAKVKHQSTQTYQSFWTKKGWINIAVLKSDELNAGDEVVGTAIAASEQATFIIEEGWHMQVDQYGTKILNINPQAVTQNDTPANKAISLALFTNRFTALADHMGAVLQRTAFSVNIKERLDFSCALLDKHGQLVVNAPHIPVHLGSMGFCVREVIKHLSLAPGETVITNHPAYGGSHLPDITLIRGLFDDNRQLIAYIANRAHHAEIGGKTPGSMPMDAVNLEEEGVVIAPMKFSHTHIDWEDIRSIFRNAKFPSRNIEENLADLQAALASLNAGEGRMQQLLKQFGAETLLFNLQEIQDYSHHKLQEHLANISATEWMAKGALDDGSPLTMKIQKQDQNLIIDFSGSADMHLNNLNATPAIVNSVVMYAMRLWVNAPLPLNDGLLRSIQLKIPTGILNPNFGKENHQCPAVAGGNTELSQKLCNLMLEALGLSAHSQGTMNNLLMGNERFGYYETLAGGTGAGPTFNGQHAVQQHMTNTRITDAEILEQRYPVAIKCLSIRKDSGGKGDFIGGDGFVRVYDFSDTMQLTLLSQSRKVAPSGLNGASSGKEGKQWLLRKDGSKKDLAGLFQEEVHRGDSLYIATPGGGAYNKKN